MNFGEKIPINNSNNSELVSLIKVILLRASTRSSGDTFKRDKKIPKTINNIYLYCETMIEVNQYSKIQKRSDIKKKMQKRSLSPVPISHPYLPSLNDKELQDPKKIQY
jgi:hypothetical protein